MWKGSKGCLKLTEMSIPVTEASANVTLIFFFFNSLRIETCRDLRLSIAEKLGKQQGSQPSSQLGNSLF